MLGISASLPSNSTSVWMTSLNLYPFSRAHLHHHGHGRSRAELPCTSFEFVCRGIALNECIPGPSQDGLKYWSSLIELVGLIHEEKEKALQSLETSYSVSVQPLLGQEMDMVRVLSSTTDLTWNTSPYRLRTQLPWFQDVPIVRCAGGF